MSAADYCADCDQHVDLCGCIAAADARHDLGAVERATPIVQVAGGVATTTSMRIANGTGNQHESVIRIIRTYLADFEEFGRVRFEIGPLPTAATPCAPSPAAPPSASAPGDSD